MSACRCRGSTSVTGVVATVFGLLVGRIGIRRRVRRVAGELTPRRLGGPLLGFLLAAALRAAVAPLGHDPPGGEAFGVVGPLLVDAVFRHAEAQAGGQLL